MPEKEEYPEPFEEGTSSKRTEGVRPGTMRYVVGLEASRR